MSKVSKVSGTALLVGLLAAAPADAACRTTIPDVDIIHQGPVNVQDIFPLGTGGTVNALTSVINTANTAFLTNTTAFVSAPGGVAPDQQGGGTWARGIAGNVESKATGVATVPSFFGNPLPAGSAQTCDTTVDQTFYGFQVGHDISILNYGATGLNWHVGATAGSMHSGLKDNSTNPGGTLRGDFEVPFVGVYTAVTQGNFFADAQVRWDFYQAKLSDIANGLYNQRLDAQGFSVTGNVGYRFDDVFRSSFFVEPSIGGVISNVTVDPFNVSGTMVDPYHAGVAVPGTAKIDDVESALGRASLRFGTNITSEDGTMAASPFVTASVFHEFADDVTTTVRTNIAAAGFSDPDATATVRTSRVGTYAQIGIGSSFALINSGLLGYARVDYRTGDNVEGVSVNSGLRYQFTPRADLESLKDGGAYSLKDGPAYPYVHDWTGAYAGASAGATLGQQDWRFTGAGTSADPDFGGYLAGGQIGYNYQVGRFVLGAEADIANSNARGGKGCPNGFFFSCEANLDWLGSLTGRVGYTWDRALFYAKGGLAFGDVTVRTHVNTGTVDLFDFATQTLTPNYFEAPRSVSDWQTGWIVGGGVEFALTENWSGRAEYTHFDLGSAGYRFSDATAADVTTTGDTVRVGVNYRFAR